MKPRCEECRDAVGWGRAIRRKVGAALLCGTCAIERALARRVAS